MSSQISRYKIFEALTSENLGKLPIPLNDQTVTISDPTPLVGSGNPDPDGKFEKWDTMVTLTAIEGSGYHGSANIYYSRLNLNLFTGTDALCSEVPFTPQMLVDSLNANHASLLILDDLQMLDTTQFPCSTGVVACVQLQAVDTSLGWVGDVWVPMVIGIPCEAPTLHNLLHNVMTQKSYWL